MHTHTFALYQPAIVASISNRNAAIFVIHKKEYPALHHQLKDVLRIAIDDECILFDEKVHITVQIVAVDRTAITIQLSTCTPNAVHKPAIVIALPLLKKDDLEVAVNGLVQVGASIIQLVITHKSRASLFKNELSRLERLVHAAAEQSKNFAFPQLLPPLCLADLILKYQSHTKILFHPEGQSFFDAAHSSDPTQPLLAFVGPEGDITAQEYELVQRANFLTVRLTPTTLTAATAAIIGVALLRSR